MAGADASEFEEIEATGKTVDDAVENALAELGLERHQVTVAVVSEGRPGLFGIGGEAARVRVGPASHEMPTGDELGFAKETVEKLLDLMGIDATVTVRAPETGADGSGLTRAVLDVEGDDLGVLIGRRGSTLSSLQYVTNLIVGHRYQNMAPFAVDVEGYRRRREETLRAMAFRMAERVRKSGRPVTLEPMPPNERRIIHMALSKDPTVETASVGEGESRKVAISIRR
ncbi:MAG: RNA-binding cell elongation regulator Jag/EloR [Dehalococcoidia bacterium]